MPSAASSPRIHCPIPLAVGAGLALPPAAARHVQVLRLQPGHTLTLFDGRGGEYAATVTHMGRSEVRVEVGAHDPVEREASRAVHLALGMPANERMDWLVEKATELGAASIQPLAVERSVLRLAGERAEKKQLHWQGVAIAACEQCGRNRVPVVHPVRTLQAWLAMAPDGDRYLLSPAAGAPPLDPGGGPASVVLSGPEGGLNPAEEAAARNAGFSDANLGPRVLRAETAPLAALVRITMHP